MAHGGIFVKVKKSTPSTQPSAAQHPPITGFELNTLSQLRNDARLIAIIGLFHNQVLIFTFFYAFVFMASVLNNTHFRNIKDAEFQPVIKLIFHASLTVKVIMFIMTIVILLLLCLQQWTAYRLFTSTDHTITRHDSYLLARLWLPFNNALIIIFFSLMIIAFFMDLVSLGMQITFSLCVRLVSFSIVLKFLMELRKKEVSVVIPSQVRFPKATPSYTPEGLIAGAGSSKNKEGHIVVPI